MDVLIPKHNKVSLGNNELFTGTSVPTATAVGDLWYKPTDNGIPGTVGLWFWSGSDWLSADTKESNKLGTITTTYELLAPANFNNKVQILGVASQIIYTAPLGVDSSQTDYWTLQIRTHHTGIITTLDGRSTTLKPVANKWARSFTSIPLVYTYSSTDPGSTIYKNLVAVGSPATLLATNWEVCLVYRYIHP